MTTLNHPYPEPECIFSRNTAVRVVGAHTAFLETPLKAPVEIEFIEGVGWSLEVRYDLVKTDVRRQPYSGVQEGLRRAHLSIASEADVIKAGEHSLIFERETGSLLCETGGVIYWSSNGCPFSSHEKGVVIQEDIQSREHPSWDEPTPWRLKPEFFETYMARFRYAAPAGAILGLPGQAGEFNKRGYRYHLFNTDQPAHIPSRPEMYQSWPIVFHRDAAHTGWVGVFHDNPARTYVDLGDFYKDTILFESITNNTRVYIVHAETLAGVTAKFVKLLGKPVLPPSWAFGYQQCRYSYMTSDEIRHVGHKLREGDIPCDALYFDIDYMDGYRVFTNNPHTFGDLKECIEDLAKDGFKSVCIIDPGVKIDSGYPIYDTLLKEDATIKNADGEPFEIVCWPGKAVLPDFFNPRVRSVWATMQGAWLKEFKFDGIWNDMNEPSNFDGGREKTATALSSEGPFRDLFNIYGASMAQASAAGWSKAHPDKRGVIITRSGYPGVQRHAVIWHGDNYAWWEHLRLAVDTCISYSLCGAFYTGPDLPGFFGNAPDDMALRAFQIGAFLPLYRGHGYKLNSSKEPFAYGAPASALIKDAIKLRYSLATEWYSHFERCVRSGIPPMQPVFSDENSPVRDTFMLFEKMLVVAITNRDERARAIWLPEGMWYRLGDTTTPLIGGRWISESITIEKIPVFVKGGSIVVRNKPGRNVEETFRNPRYFEIYRDEGGSASGYISLDDGSSTDHTAWKRVQLTVENGETSVRQQDLD